MSIHYLQGDATSPQATGNAIVCHVCNDVGGWGQGFVVAVSKRWPEPEAAYRAWYAAREQNDFGLGGVQLVQVEPEKWVANMVAQVGTRPKNGKPPIRYDAVSACLPSSRRRRRGWARPCTRRASAAGSQAGNGRKSSR
ncbi:MAG: hypothetical protein QM756_45180 [Polyangiaceae bacterium]